MKIDNENVSNYHAQYQNTSSQYWHPSSQDYAGGDNLVTAIFNGWEVNDKVERYQHWFAGMRGIMVYRFELERDGDKMIMPVLDNPYVSRLVELTHIQVVEK